MDNDLELKLIVCLDALEAGESIEQILARYSADAAALRPLLEIATALPTLAMTPTLAAQASSRRAFLNQPAEKHPSGGRALFGLPLRLGLALTLLLALLLVGGGMATATTALPGEPLYGVKRSAEQVEVALAGDKQAVALRIEQRRRDEVRQLISAGRQADVQFSGRVERANHTSLFIDGIRVVLDSETLLEGQPRTGAYAEVAGRTSNAGVRAAQVTIALDSSPPAAPSPTVTATATPTTQPTATATVAPASATPLPTATVVPASTATALPSPTTLPLPTAVPVLPTALPTAVPTLAPPPSPAPTIAPPPPEPTAPPSDDNDNGNDDNGNDDNGNDDSGGDDNDNGSGGGDNSGGDDDSGGRGGGDNSNGE